MRMNTRRSGRRTPQTILSQFMGRRLVDVLAPKRLRQQGLCRRQQGRPTTVVKKVAGISQSPKWRGQLALSCSAALSQVGALGQRCRGRALRPPLPLASGLKTVELLPQWQGRAGALLYTCLCALCLQPGAGSLTPLPGCALAYLPIMRESPSVLTGLSALCPHRLGAQRVPIER